MCTRRRQSRRRSVRKLYVVTGEEPTVRVKLTKKFAEMLCGIDLSRAREGDVLDVEPRDAGILLASEWALPAERDVTERDAERKVLSVPRRTDAAANDRSRRRRA
jgi:hypothetical protein